MRRLVLWLLAGMLALPAAALLAGAVAGLAGAVAFALRGGQP